MNNSLKLPYKYLVFEGGGVKGLAYTKIPKVLKEFGILHNINKVAGSSVGSIIALLIALKYDSEEIIEIMKNLNLAEFKDTRPSYTWKMYNLVFKCGIYSGQLFENWIKEHIYYITGSYETTFKELYEYSEIELVITGTSLATKSTQFFSYKTTPDMEIWQACRISVAIPCFFTPVKIDNDLYVDGGLLYNYPIWIFDNPFSYEYNIENLDFQSELTLGFKLVSSKSSDFVSSMPKILPIITFFYMLIGTFLGFIDNSYMQQTYWDRTVGIDTSDIQTTEFNISDERKNLLIKNGYENTKIYLQNKLDSIKESLYDR